MSHRAPAPDDSSSSGSKIWLYLSALLVVPLVVIGLIILVGQRVGDDREAATPPVSAGPSQTASADDDRPTCTDTKDAFKGIEFAPTGVRVRVPVDPGGTLLRTEKVRGTRTQSSPPTCLLWQRVGTSFLPFTTTDGPNRRVNGRFDTFAHTPQGAALAAIHIQFAAMNLRGNQLRELVANHVIASEQQRASLIEGLEQLARDDAYAQAGMRVKVLDYDGESTRIAIGVGTDPLPDDEYQAVTAQLIWNGNDWQLSAPNGFPPTYSVTDLTGWEKWS